MHGRPHSNSTHRPIHWPWSPVSAMGDKIPELCESMTTAVRSLRAWLSACLVHRSCTIVYMSHGARAAIHRERLTAGGGGAHSAWGPCCHRHTIIHTERTSKPCQSLRRTEHTSEPCQSLRGPAAGNAAHGRCYLEAGRISGHRRRRHTLQPPGWCC